MYYPQELYPRPRPRIHESGLLMPQKLAQRNSTSKFLGRMLPYFKEYCACSSVHGVRYLTEPKMRHFERLTWLLILIGTCICATIVYVDLSELYTSNPIHTTIDNSMQPVFYVPFPSVGICLRNRVNLQRLENEASDFFLGVNATPERKDIFKRFVTAVSDVHFDDFRSLASFFGNSTLAAGVGQLDDLNIRTILEYVHVGCSEVFLECTWRTRPRNCCEIFEVQRTELGICWVFNSAVSEKMRQREKEDKFYPLRTSMSGPGTGLDVYLHRNKSEIRPGMRGVYIMLKQPEQWSDSARKLPTNSNNRISMMPRHTGSDERTRSLPPKSRGCLFPDETDDPHYRNLPGFVYWRGNCRSRCHQEYAVDLCNCSPSLLFPNSEEDNFTDCTASDFKCLYDNRCMFSSVCSASPRLKRHILTVTFAIELLNQEQEYVNNIKRDSMTCNCLNSCTQLIYDSVHSSTAIDFSDVSPDMETMHIDVYFQSPWFIKYQTHMRFTFVELLASFGGIIGLFLGASLLSAIELVYYFTIGLYFYLYNDKASHKLPPPPQPPAAAAAAVPAAPITVHFRHKITPNKISY
ncbi:hypothetical protein KR222_007505 [Zaprionus bogoriensis]|nr:hypothetical protein KR222_007505 [Zaprionus bogoriensis]